MAPPPEYDKEPKAPDKSVTNISTDDSKILYNLVKDHQNNSDHKPSNAAANADIENNKHVGALDDGQLRALLDEAIAYKRPKDREGKSSLFKELLEEVEQDEQACEAAARNVTGRRGARGSGHGRRALPHSNSLQDLMAAALAAEPPRQRAHAHPPPASVSARAHHGGSLPSGVDTSFMMSEEPARGGYLATVRCVNPPPLAERRVSASDANAPADHDHFRRSKPVFPVTYTARATLEIGSSSVCSGRAVTTTTPSNQITPLNHARATCAPNDEQYKSPLINPDARSQKLMNALKPKTQMKAGDLEPKYSKSGDVEDVDRCSLSESPRDDCFAYNPKEFLRNISAEEQNSQMWMRSVDNWYEGLNNYFVPNDIFLNQNVYNVEDFHTKRSSECINVSPFVKLNNNNNDTASLNFPSTACPIYKHQNANTSLITTETWKKSQVDIKYKDITEKQYLKKSLHDTRRSVIPNTNNSIDEDSELRKKYREMVKTNLVKPSLHSTIPKYFKTTTIGNIEEETPSNNDQWKELNETCRSNVNGTNSQSLERKLAVGDPNGSTNNLNGKAHHANRETTSTVGEENDLNLYEMKDLSKNTSAMSEVEKLNHSSSRINSKNGSFSQFVNEQEKLFQMLEFSNNETDVLPRFSNTEKSSEDLSKSDDIESKNIIGCGAANIETDNFDGLEIDNQSKPVNCVIDGKIEESCDIKGSNNNYITLTLPSSYPCSTNTKIKNTAYLKDIKKKDLKTMPVEKTEKEQSNTSNKEQKAANSYNDRAAKKSALALLLFENLFPRADRLLSGIKVINEKEIDSAIPYSCITTPEVVSSCNTTASTTQLAIALDPKPLQLSSSYRAVTCLTGEPLSHTPPQPAAPPQPSAPPASPTHEQPRSVISSNLNGLPLSRPGYAASTIATISTSGLTATPSDDNKKSLDENCNALQAFSSPLSGSSHNKKPRRKKSTKNETVIKSQEIDGYQGNKDLNEVLRFIESNAETTRGHKVRAKHKDDDEKSKKRSTERRKDKENKMKRASSLEELSRTKLEDLTDKPAPRTEPAKPERRSWGDDAREPREFCPEVVELTDFQTVTKKRKPKRRPDEPEPPRRTRQPAPPSDRSNDSNDDMDSVHSLHSLPADAPPTRPVPPTHASYADIARTRHNIPDLIESCNFYENEAAGEPKRADPPAPAAASTGEDYPALETRKKRDKPRPARKEKPETARTGDCPAPDVVADRRPAVILLDCTSRPRDMDGVTFGFDINEQLVGGTRRPRCDLVRDALEGAVAVAVGGGALRYMPPHTRHDATHLHQIVDYVGAAWEDVFRCGGGKVRYFSE